MRTLEEINKEYVDVCARAGQLQFRLKESEKELDLLNQMIKALCDEAKALEKKDV